MDVKRFRLAAVNDNHVERQSKKQSTFPTQTLLPKAHAFDETRGFI